MNSIPSLRTTFLISLLLFASASAVWSATYYVDSSGGDDGNSGTSPESAWQTLSKVNSVTFSPGDSILFIRGGEWTGQLTPAGSGSSGSPIVMDAYGSTSLPLPLIQGNGLAYATILLENQPYWELRNLEVTNTGATDADRVGIYIGAEDYGQLDHVHLINLVVHDVNGLSGVTNNANGGIFFNITGDTTPTWFNGILVDGCYIFRCAQRGLSGPYSTWDTRTLTTNTDWTPSTNVIIRNSLFEHCRRQGLVWRVAEGVLIEHNIFANCSDGGHGNAMFVFNTDDAVIQMNESYGTRYEESGDPQDASGIDIDFRTKRTIVQYNYSHDNGEGGIIATGGGTTTPGSESFNDGSIIRYNILQNNRRWGIHFSGRLTNTEVYNNTLYLSSIIPEPVAIFHFSSWSGWPDGTSFYNNIIDNNSYEASYELGSSTNNSFDHNLFYDANDPATGEPSDPHKLTSDPLLVAGGTGGYGWDTVDGYMLRASSPALSSGVLVSGNGGRDYFGNTVSASSAPNRGAYQGPGVSAAAAPTFSSTGGFFDSGQTVSLSSTTSGATIYYTMDGSTPSPVQGTEYTGSLSINETVILQAVATKSGLADSPVAKLPVIILGGTTTVLEAEDLSVFGNGAIISELADTETTGGACVIMSSTDTTQWMEFSTGTIPAGTYRFSMRFKGFDTRGQHYVMLDAKQLGETIDQYSPTSSYETVDLGVVVFPTTTSHNIRLVTNGANPSSSGYSITADHFVFLAPPNVDMEAEDLSRTVSGASAAVGPDWNASGRQWVSFSADGVNDYIEFTTRHVLAGSYQLKLRYKGYTSRGEATIRVDGNVVGSAIDQYAPASSYEFVDVGPVTFGADGTHAIRMTVSGKNGSSSGYTLAADEFVLAPLPIEAEAESLSRTSGGASTAVVSDASASGGSWVSLSSDSVGDYVEFTTGSIGAGAYDLNLLYKGYPTRGTLQASVDGVDVGDELDQYEASTMYLTANLGSVTFDSAGMHTIRLTVTGQNGSSSGYTLSADTFVLTPQ